MLFRSNCGLLSQYCSLNIAALASSQLFLSIAAHTQSTHYFFAILNCGLLSQYCSLNIAALASSQLFLSIAAHSLVHLMRLQHTPFNHMNISLIYIYIYHCCRLYLVLFLIEHVNSFILLQVHAFTLQVKLQFFLHVTY